MAFQAGEWGRAGHTAGVMATPLPVWRPSQEAPASVGRSGMRTLGHTCDEYGLRWLQGCGQAFQSHVVPVLTQAALKGYTGHAQTHPSDEGQSGDEARRCQLGERQDNRRLSSPPHPHLLGTSCPHHGDFARATLSQPHVWLAPPVTQDRAPSSPPSWWPTGSAVAYALITTPSASRL